jgi:hypothetical protein
VSGVSIQCAGVPEADQVSENAGRKIKVFRNSGRSIADIGLKKWTEAYD